MLIFDKVSLYTCNRLSAGHVQINNLFGPSMFLEVLRSGKKYVTCSFHFEEATERLASP